MANVGVCNLEYSNPIFKDMIYRMDQKERGLALIINFEDYHTSQQMSKRSGSQSDMTNLTNTFKELPFDVDACVGIKDKEKTTEWVEKKLNEVTQKEGYGCLVVVVMTHGGEDGKLVSFDGTFKVEDIWKPLQNYLKGKPKLIFIQACRGDGFSESANADKDAEKYFGIHTFPFPIPMDMLIAFSSWTGCKSFRAPFITELCKEIENNKERHILQIMTSVLQNLSKCTFYEKKTNEQMPTFVLSNKPRKQMPTFVFSLKKLVFLTN